MRSIQPASIPGTLALCQAPCPLWATQRMKVTAETQGAGGVVNTEMSSTAATAVRESPVTTCVYKCGGGQAGCCGSYVYLTPSWTVI